MQVNDKWESVDNVDRAKRTAEEWAKIYKVKLREDVPSNKISEYEWAYFLGKVRYVPAAIPDTDDYDVFERMLYRADELRRDVFMGADPLEREILVEKYTETKWARTRLMMG